MKSILIPVDFSDVTEAVMKTALGIGKAFQARITLLHVAEPEPDLIGYEPGPPVAREELAHRLQRLHRRLEEYKPPFQDAGLDVHALQVQGFPVKKILSQAEKVDASLIILGSHGHGAIYNLLVGSVTEGVMKKSPVPVMVVPSNPKTRSDEG